MLGFIELHCWKEYCEQWYCQKLNQETFLYIRTNFIRTKRLKMSQNLRTSLEQLKPQTLQEQGN